MGKFEIVPLRAESVPEIVMIAEECVLAPWTEDDYLAEVGRAGSYTFQAESVPERIAAGFIIMRLITNKDEHNSSVFEILNLAVKKNYQRKGVGTKLIETVVRAARQISPAAVWLEVRASNKTAIEFYKKHGFASEYVRRNFYSGPVEDGIVMKLVV